MKRTAAVLAFLAFLSVATSVMAQKGVSGTIYFRDGGVVPFEYIGLMNQVGSAVIFGKLQGQDVKLQLSDIKEVVFTDPRALYASGDFEGGLLITNRDGEQFTLTNGWMFGGGGYQGRLSYVYRDPISKQLDAVTQDLQGVASITVGGNSGPMKQNPNSGQYFPPTYIYDPYTGEKLVWATQ